MFDVLFKNVWIADGSAENVRNAIALTGGNDTVLNTFPGKEACDTSVTAYPVDRIEMVVVTVRLPLLRVNIDAERSFQISALKVMGCERIAGEQRVHVSGVDQLGKRRARIEIECDRRAENPKNLSVLPIMPKHVIEIVIILRKRRFSRSVLPERKNVPF